jgi:hypothetical protein
MGEGRKYNAVTSIDFDKRDEDYPEELSKKLPCLDNCIFPAMPKELAASGKSPYDFSEKEWEACYEELKRIFQQGTPSGDDDEGNGNAAGDDDSPRPPRRRDELDDDDAPRQRRQEKEADDDAPPARKESTNGKGAVVGTIKKGDKVMHNTKPHWGKCEVLHVNSDNTLRIEDEDGQSHDKVLQSDVSLEGAKEEAPRQQERTPNGSKATSPPPDDEDDLEDEEDEDLEDEEEAPRSRSRR